MSGLQSPESTLLKFDQNLYAMQSHTNLSIPEQSFSCYLSETTNKVDLSKVPEKKHPF